LTLLPPRAAPDLLPVPGVHLPDIVSALETTGWIVIEDFLAPDQWQPLAVRARTIEDYRRAGVGRGDHLLMTPAIRRDRIHWLEAEEAIDQCWLALMEEVRLTVNRELFLGLFEYECHFACYPPGAFYLRHVDAFKGAGNRRVSTVFYLNDDWQPGDGGELLLYPPDQPGGVSITPRGGTLVVFLSEDLPHEVLQTRVERYSMAGWFRINGTDSVRLDPPV
jgi:SM-20-related protein